MLGTIDGVMTLQDAIGYEPPAQVFESEISSSLDEEHWRGSRQQSWLQVSGQTNWQTPAGTVDSVVLPTMSDREKALALYQQHINARFHASTNDGDLMSPTQGLQRIRIRKLLRSKLVFVGFLWYCGWIVPGSCSAVGGACHQQELWFDGRWNLLDGDTQSLYLLRDNHTIASNADLVYDHDLVKRTHTYGVDFSTSQQNDEFSASLFYSSQYQDIFQQWGVASYPTDSMDMTLRPGEALEWRWGSGTKYHGLQPLSTEVSPLAATRIANGKWTYDIDFTGSAWSYAAADVFHATIDSTGLYVTPGFGYEDGSFVVRMQSPYVFVGGQVQTPNALAVYLSWDESTWQKVTKTTDDGAVGSGRLLPAGWGGKLFILLARRCRRDTSYGARHLGMMSKWRSLAMPGLQLGANVISYRDETPVAHSIEITHSWLESYANSPPNQVTSALSPPDGGTVLGSKLQFRWQPATDVDGDSIADYEFILSDRPDVRWALSSNFHQVVSVTPDAELAQFTLQHTGLLEFRTLSITGECARGAILACAWGPMERGLFLLPTRTPHPPENVALTVDPNGRTATLTWNPAATGEAPVSYHKVYGSDEKGFTISDSQYPVWVGNQGDSNTLTSPFAANILTTTTTSSIQVVGASLNASASNRTFYRVVAVDAFGIESGPSDYAELSRPFIFTQPATTATVGAQYEYDAKTIASLGDVAINDDLGSDEYAATFWDIEHPIYSISGAPNGISINSSNGIVSGVPSVAGSYDVQLIAQIGATVDTQSFTLVVY